MSLKRKSEVQEPSNVLRKQPKQQLETVIHEYESSISLSISKRLFEYLGKKAKPIGTTTISYYESGERSVCNSNNIRFERKTIEKRYNICKIYLFDPIKLQLIKRKDSEAVAELNAAEKNKVVNKKPPNKVHLDQTPIFLPLVRKVATETVVAAPNISLITSIIDRKILHFHNNIRICLETQATREGSQHYLTAEVEYSELVSEDYKKLFYDYEENLVDTIFDVFGVEWLNLLDDTDVLYQKIPLSALIGLSSRKFGTIGEAGIISGIKHKFDGYKGKIIFRESSAAFYSDLNLCKNISVHNLKIKFPENIIFQVEIMTRFKTNRRPSLIFTDVIGFKRANSLYMTEPVDVIRFFNWLNQKYSINSNIEPEHTITINKTSFRIKMQTSLKSYNETTNEMTDGMILISGNREFKFKRPTIDAELVQVNLKRNQQLNLFGIGNISLFVPTEEITKALIQSDVNDQMSIYELALYEHIHRVEFKSSINGSNFNSQNAYLASNSGEPYVFTIIRKRKDRHTPSSLEELNKFIREVGEYNAFIHTLNN